MHWSEDLKMNIENHKHINLHTQAKTSKGLVKALKKEYSEFDDDSYNFVNFTEIFYEYK